jgi:hypothetical protein
MHRRLRQYHVSESDLRVIAEGIETQEGLTFIPKINPTRNGGVSRQIALRLTGWSKNLSGIMCAVRRAPLLREGRLTQVQACYSAVQLFLREPGKLEGCSGHGMLTRKVDGNFPLLIGKLPVDFEVLADALDQLNVNVI